MTDGEYLLAAVKYAERGIDAKDGGPFGALVVKDGKIIGRGWNRVISLNDPTAHAEIIAIRDACSFVGSFSLKGSVLYSSCEPCPMCLASAYWANIETIYYGATQDDAESIGFSDAEIYRQFVSPIGERSLPVIQVPCPAAASLMREWALLEDRIKY